MQQDQRTLKCMANKGMQLFAGNDLGTALRHLLSLDHLNPNWKGISVYQKNYSDLSSTLTMHLGTCFNMNSTIHMNSPTADSKAPYCSTLPKPLIEIPQCWFRYFCIKNSVWVPEGTKIQLQQKQDFPDKWKIGWVFFSACLEDLVY